MCGAKAQLLDEECGRGVAFFCQFNFGSPCTWRLRGQLAAAGLDGSVVCSVWKRAGLPFRQVGYGERVWEGRGASAGGLGGSFRPKKDDRGATIHQPEERVGAAAQDMFWTVDRFGCAKSLVVVGLELQQPTMESGADHPRPRTEGDGTEADASCEHERMQWQVVVASATKVC